MIYLYAIVAGEPAGPLGEGVVGEPLHLVHRAGIAAVVGEPISTPRPDRETLVAQEAVVRRLAGCFEAILPARFGERLLEAELDARAADLTAALALVRGCVQMTLRVFGEPEPATLSIAENGGPGTRYLAARRREWERERSLPEIDPLRAVLQPLLRAERIERHAAGLLLGTAYHLVRREEAGAYRAALAGAEERLGGRRIAVSGPWPPYAFGPEAGR